MLGQAWARQPFSAPQCLDAARLAATWLGLVGTGAPVDLFASNPHLHVLARPSMP